MAWPVLALAALLFYLSAATATAMTVPVVLALLGVFFGVLTFTRCAADLGGDTGIADLKANLAAVDRVQGIVEFTMDGAVSTANDSFLNCMGYTLEEIRGKHHSLFVEPEYGASAEYRQLWDKLNRGEVDSGEYKHIGKHGGEVWVQACYSPVFGPGGRPHRVIACVADVTARRQREADYRGQIEAIDKSQAIVEFDLDGNILSANHNFLDTMGYRLAEIQGKHHSLFVEPDYRASPQYRQFWEQLKRGEFDSGEYKRIGKGGREVWIQASYNPVFDSDGKPYKIIKYAADITARRQRDADYRGQIEAISKSQAVIEFDLDGNILSANDNFLDTMGYRLEEIRGKHHSLFVAPDYKASAQYRQFWEQLKRGEFDSGEYQRVDKHGREVWIQASYNPIFDLNGKPCKVIKYAIDVTARKQRDADYRGQIEAIGKSQAVIEFDLGGNILNANDNFLDTMGYSLAEIQGKHHSLFVEPDYKASPQYRQFWEQLNRGEFDSGEYKRIGKGGREVWIQASYNPILDVNGKLCKIIKYATDITARRQRDADYRGQIEAISKSQAVIEFDLDGNILNANDNFLNTMGYRLEEIRGKHHSLFVEPDYKASPQYRQFWERLNRGEFDSGEYKRIGREGREVWIQASYNPIFDLNGKASKVVKYATDITEQKLRDEEGRRAARENLRMKQALDVCDTSVMIADDELNIIYMNHAVTDMLRRREQQIRTQLASFNVASLLGCNVDQFHKTPSHQRSMLRDLKDSYQTDLALAGLTFGLIATPIFDEHGTRLGTVVEWNDKTDRLAQEHEEQQIAAANARVKQALDNVSANVMIADNEFNIIYLNDAVSGMMRTAQSDIRKQLPAFDVDKLMGASIDIFHKNPAHQRSMVSTMNSTFRSEIIVGGRTFGLVANPIVVDGKRIGTVVEWADRTAEVVIEGEIDTMVEAAGAGDFTKQIALDGKEGFFKNLSGGLNTLVSTIEVALNDVLRMLGALARGDLTERIARDYQGSFGQLKNDANGTADKLTDVIGNIRASATAISSAANEIAQGNADLSQRTEEQASSLEQTASSMEQMTSAVKQSAENAVQANTLAGEAQQKAREGGEVVSRAVSAMDEINSASKKISDIIGVIDEIAFQTNLLALNAAVEAARAGEQGRGFAVVAGEVRNLAQRSAGAAKEIKDLIRDSVTKVDDGTQLVNQSGETLQEIVAAVEKVSNMMREISGAAQEQTSGIEQVNTAVSQMDEMTQQNAALVEQASAAGESMAEQARGMSNMVDFFSVDENAIGNSPKPALQVVKQPSARPGKAAADGGNDQWEEF